MTYNTNDFEVILISSDGSAKAQSNYMKKYNMPWFALKNQSEAARNLSLSLEVEYIPYLVILDPSGNVITKEGKKDITTFNNALESLERTGRVNLKTYRNTCFFHGFLCFINGVLSEMKNTCD